MTYLSEGPSFRHFKLLRKAIMHRKSGALHFRTVREQDGLLLLDKGRMLPAEAESPLLRFLHHPVRMAHWEDAGVQIDGLPAHEVVARVIDHVAWSPEEMRALCAMFGAFSALTLSPPPVVFSNSLTDLSYQLLRQRIDADEHYALADFLLKANTDNALLVHRLRVLSYVYVLGLLRSRKGKPKHLGVKSPPAALQEGGNVATIRRIMRRIRGIAGS